MVKTPMKITAIEVLRYSPAPSEPRTKPRGEVWHSRTDVSHPLSRYRGRRVNFNDLMPWGDVWVRVHAENGQYGFGATQFGGPVATLISDHLGPSLIGEDCLAFDRLADLMFRLTKPYGSAGIASCAVSAIDLALWDLRGKIFDQPVYRLLGGEQRSVECYATGNDVDWSVELGFDSVKITLSYGPEAGLDGLDRNEAYVAACREKIGAHRELLIDCWMSLDVDYAQRLAERLRPYQIGWLEECLLPEDLDGHIALRQRVPWLTLASGEHWYSPLAFQWAANHRAVDVLQPDIQWCGGLTSLTKIAGISDAAGIGFIPHLAGATSFGQHASVGIANIHRVEYRIATPPGVPLEEAKRAPGTVLPSAGRIKASEAPGFGIEIAPEHLTPYQT